MIQRDWKVVEGPHPVIHISLALTYPLNRLPHLLKGVPCLVPITLHGVSFLSKTRNVVTIVPAYEI